MHIIHFLKRAHNSVFSVQAVLSNQNAEPAGDQDQDHCKESHAKEILRLIMHMFRILWAHPFTLKCLCTLFKRFLLDSLDRLFGLAHYSVHVNALHEEEHSRNNVKY